MLGGSLEPALSFWGTLRSKVRTTVGLDVVGGWDSSGASGAQVGVAVDSMGTRVVVVQHGESCVSLGSPGLTELGWEGGRLARG